MDLATVVGIVLGFGVVMFAIVSGGGWQSFLHVPSLLVTLGGMLCSTLIHFSMSQFLGIFSVVKKTFVAKTPSPSELIQQMVNYAAINRRDGALALEQEIHVIDDAFTIKGLQMLRSLSSPDAIGQGMAVALLTTFYGAFVANLIFIPLAGKLGIHSQAERMAMEMITEGVCAIARGDNPTSVREKMQAFVSQSRREEVRATV